MRQEIFIYGRILESFVLHQKVFCFIFICFVNRNHDDDNDIMEINHR